MRDILIKARTKKDGKVVYEYRFEIASVDGKRKWKTKSGFRTKTEAKEAGKLAQREYETTGRVIEPSTMSYSDFLDLWIENYAKLSCKQETVTGYEKKIRLYIKPVVGELRLGSITKDNLQALLNEMFDNGFAQYTLSAVRGIITSSFNYAVDRHYLQSSPAIGLKNPKKARPKVKTRTKPHVYIPKEKMDEVFTRFPEGTSGYVPLMIGYHCGLRLGEIFALTWDDVDLKEKTLTVNRQVQWFAGKRTKEEIHKTNGTSKSDGYWYFSEPKYKSYRVITLDDELAALLCREFERQKRAEEYYAEYYQRYYAEDALYFGGSDPDFLVLPINKISTAKSDNEINFVCRRENGSYVTPRTTQHISAVVHKQLNFPEFDIHSLRHTHATMLMENGVDMIYIQKRLGHKDMSVTMNIYTNHMTDKIRENNSKRLNDIFAEEQKEAEERVGSGSGN